MKKHLVLLLAVLLCVSLSASPIYLDDLKSEALGGIGMSVYDEELSYLHNPASLSLRNQSTRFYIGSSFHDDINGNNFSSGIPNPLLSNPLLSTNFRFLGRNAALSIMLHNKLAYKEAGADGSYGIYDTTSISDLHLAVSYGWENLSFGFGINGGNASQRTDIRIHTKYNFLDYLLQTLFERHQTIIGSDFVSLSLGVIGKAGNFSFGLTFDEMTSVTSDNKINLNLGVMLMTMNVGMHFRGSSFDAGNAGLILVVPSVGVEVHNAFLSAVEGTEYEALLPAEALKDRRSEVSMGFELMFQLSSSFTASFLTGLKSGPFRANQFLRDAVHSIGIQVAYGKYEFLLSVQIPFGVYGGRETAVSAALGLNVSL